MGQVVNYCFVIDNSSEYLKENKKESFETGSLSNLPSVGDIMEFSDSRYGPVGKFSVIKRIIELSSLDVERVLKVIILIEKSSCS